MLLSSVILQQSSLSIFFPLLSSLYIGKKINMGPLPDKFVTIPIALTFLSIALMLDMGIFRQVAIFYRLSLTYEA